LRTALTLHPAAPDFPSIQVRSARLEDQPPEARGPAPTWINIPDIAVSAAILPVGVDSRKESMQIPNDVRLVGWYRFGSTPSRPGSTVLVAHVDSARQGAGVFFLLQDLPIGARITVRLADNSLARYRVVGRRSYPKADLPRETFTRSGRSRLVLITCGGGFDATTRHYTNNVVVFAVPDRR